MITVVDRKDEVVVQKVTKSDGTVLRYQYGRPGNAADMMHAGSLTEARVAIGKGQQKVSA